MDHKDQTDDEVRKFILANHHFWKKDPPGRIEYKGGYPLTKEKIDKRWKEILEK